MVQTVFALNKVFDCVRGIKCYDALIGATYFDFKAWKMSTKSVNNSETRITDCKMPLQHQSPSALI